MKNEPWALSHPNILTGLGPSLVFQGRDFFLLPSQRGKTWGHKAETYHICYVLEPPTLLSSAWYCYTLLCPEFSILKSVSVYLPGKAVLGVDEKGNLLKV